MKLTPDQRVARAQRLYAGLALIEKRGAPAQIKQAARELAMVALDLLAEERAAAKRDGKAPPP